MQRIERNWDGMPALIKDKIEDGCMFENTLVGFGTIIIDKDFIDEMYNIADSLKDDKNLVSLLTKVSNEVRKYYSSSIVNDKSRQQTYDNNLVVDEDGMIIGTKLSSLKGKNISRCSEKSIAAYTILERLFSMGYITREPVLTLSYLTTNSTEPEPHAFIMLNKESCDYPTKHILFDIENPTLVESDNIEQSFVGLYTLTDEQYSDFLNGLECVPNSIYELGGSYTEIGEKRTYGNLQNNYSK